MGDKQANLENQKTNANTILGALAVTLILLTSLFIFLTQGEARTVGLLKNELKNLEQQKQLLASSQDIYKNYANKIDTIASVFPTEETVAVFISTLESELKRSGGDYTFKFSAVTPLPEQDRLYLPLTITLNTDLVRLADFLGRIEGLPYMIHITSMSAKTPGGFSATGEVTLMVKVYVQNPFTVK